MKKKLMVVLSLLLVLSMLTGVAACAESETAAEEQTAPAGQGIGTMSSDDIMAMSNYMNKGNIAKSGKWTLRWTFANNRIRLKSINTLSGESAVISSGEDSPEEIYTDGVWVTYLADDGKSNSIKRVRVTGGEESVLIGINDVEQKGAIQYLLEYGDYYYFSVNNEASTGTTGTLYRADKDGGNITVILEKPVYYPYIINDRLYYQDDLDDCKLHVCNLDGSGDEVFIDDFCYQYVTDGKIVCYNTYNGEVEWNDYHQPTNTQDLRRVLKIYHLDDGSTEVIEDVHPMLIAFNGDKVYYLEELDSKRLYSYDIKTGMIDAMYFETYLYFLMFMDSNHILCVNQDKSEYVEDGMLLVNLDGTGISSAN